LTAFHQRSQLKIRFGFVTNSEVSLLQVFSNFRRGVAEIIIFVQQEQLLQLRLGMIEPPIHLSLD
jgi:hypothetical protein